MPSLSKKFLDEQGNLVWSDEDIKDHRKAQRRIYYEKNKSKILQNAKDRRAVKRTARVAVKNVLIRNNEKPKTKRSPKQSQYNQYVKENFKLVKARNPSLKPSSILTQVGHMWTAFKNGLTQPKKKVLLKKSSIITN